MNTEKLEIISSKVALGLILPEDLPEAALAALEDGFDSPSLRILAGLTKAESSEAWQLFNQTLAELNLLIPSKRDAVILLARKSAEQILNGKTNPYEGAKQIWELSLHVPGEKISEFDTFIYAISEWEDRPEERQIFEAGIIAGAKELSNTEY